MFFSNLSHSLIVVCLVVVFLHVFSYSILLCCKLRFGSKLGSPCTEDEKTSERNGEEWYKQLVFYVLLVTCSVRSTAIKKNLFFNPGEEVCYFQN